MQLAWLFKFSGSSICIWCLTSVCTSSLFFFYNSNFHVTLLMSSWSEMIPCGFAYVFTFNISQVFWKSWLKGSWEFSYVLVLARACGVPAVGIRAVDCWQWRSFFPFFSPSRPFLIEGVLGSKNLFNESCLEYPKTPSAPWRPYWILDLLQAVSECPLHH